MHITKKILYLFIGLIGLLPIAANAENSPLYIGLNVATFDSKYDNYEPDGGMLSFGWDLNNYFSLELAGGASKTYTDGATGNTAKVNYVASGFLRFNIRLNRITLYALAGYSQAEKTVTSGAVSTLETSSGGSYGYGIDFFGTRDLALSVRRVEFYDIDSGNEKVNLGATMFGITYYYDTPRIHSRY